MVINLSKKKSKERNADLDWEEEKIVWDNLPPTIQLDETPKAKMGVPDESDKEDDVIWENPPKKKKGGEK